MSTAIQAIERLTWKQAAVYGAVTGVLVGLFVLGLGYSVFQTVSAVVVGMCVVVGPVWYARRRGKSIESVRGLLWWFWDIRRPTYRDGAAAAVVIAASVCMTILIGTAAGLLGITDPSGHSGATGATGGGVPLWILVGFAVFAVVVGPVLEELVFRNGIQKVGADVLGVWPAIVLASAIFAAFHIPNYGGLGQPIGGIAVPMAAVFADSVIYGYAYYRTGNVVVPMVGHGAHNGLALLTLIL